MTIKPTYLVTGDDFEPSYDPNGEGERIEFKTERAALKEAKQRLADTEGQDAEVWIWRLSHVLTKPEIEPVIDIVK